MCGISGIFYFHNKANVSLHDLRNLSEKIEHRGPDSNGVWIKDNIGLAHNRLSIFDLTKKVINLCFLILRNL